MQNVTNIRTNTNTINSHRHIVYTKSCVMVALLVMSILLMVFAVIVLFKIWSPTCKCGITTASATVVAKCCPTEPIVRASIALLAAMMSIVWPICLYLMFRYKCYIKHRNDHAIYINHKNRLCNFINKQKSSLIRQTVPILGILLIVSLIALIGVLLYYYTLCLLAQFRILALLAFSAQILSILLIILITLFVLYKASTVTYVPQAETIPELPDNIYICRETSL